MQIFWRKHCKLFRTARKCSIYLYTSGECDNCGHNLKKPIKKHKKSVSKNRALTPLIEEKPKLGRYISIYIPVL
jgi:hypothetical protein